MKMVAMQDFSLEQRAQLEIALRQAVAAGTIRSLRDTQRFIVQQYVTGVLGTASLAKITSAPPA
jgi:hypothetical protein